MKKILLVILIILASYSISLAETQNNLLWEKYLQAFDHSFFYGDYLTDSVGQAEKNILEKIQCSETDNWLVYFGLYCAEEDLAYSYMIQENDNFDYGVFEDLLYLSNSHKDKACELVEPYNLKTIESPAINNHLKGHYYYAYGTLISEQELKKEAYLASYKCLQDNDCRLIPLLQLIYLNFEYKDAPIKKVFRFEDIHTDFYADEDMTYTCLQYLNSFESVMDKDFESSLKAQLYQCAVEANAYLAYAAYQNNNQKELSTRMHMSKKLLNSRFRYGDVTGGIWPEENFVPIGDIYDVHIRLLYYSQINDIASIFHAFKDFDIAYERLTIYPPLEYTPIMLEDVILDINRFKEKYNYSNH